MPKPTQSGKCNGRCTILPNAFQPSPLVADLLVCRFCKQVMKKGEPLPGAKKDSQGGTSQD